MFFLRFRRIFSVFVVLGGGTERPSLSVLCLEIMHCVISKTIDHASWALVETIPCAVVRKEGVYMGVVGH